MDVDIDQPALAKDSFRQWKRVIFVYRHEEKTISLFKKVHATKAFMVFPLLKTSMTIVGQQIGLTKRKRNPIFVRFDSEDLAQRIFEMLNPLTKDFSSEISLDDFEDATVMSNEKGVIINANSKFLKLLGYKREEVIGQNVSIMMDHHIGGIHDQLMENYWKTGVRRLIGKARLVRAKHKEGYLFPVVILLGELMENIDGQMVNRLIATLTPEEGSDDRTFTDETQSVAETTTAVFSEDDWSEDEDEVVSSEQLTEIIDKLATHIELSGCDVEGIFRLNGNFLETQELWTAVFVRGEEIDLSGENVLNLCDILKRCLQERNLIAGEAYIDLIELARGDLHDPSFYPQLFAILSSLSKTTQMILQRLFLLFSHILVRSNVNKMTHNGLSIIAAPLLIQPETNVVIEHTELFVKLLKRLIENCPVMIKQLPALKTFSLYSGPGLLTDKDWSILMTNSKVVEYSAGDNIVSDDGRDVKLYYLASGVVVIVKDNITVSSCYSGEYISELANLSRKTQIIATQPCKIIKLVAPFLCGLFESDRTIFFKFFWEQSRVLAVRLKNMPFIYEELNQFSHRNISGGETTKLEIHLSDGSSKWMGFPLQKTVQQIHKDLLDLYPKYKDAYLIETSHGRDLCKLQDDWTVEELLIRAKYACDYKIIYVVDEPKKGKGSTRQRSKTKESKDSVVIQQYPCKRKKKVGTLFILQNSILHVSKLFGLNSKSSLLYGDIGKTSQTKETLVIRTEGKPIQFVFQSESVCSEARRLIQSLAEATVISPRRSVSVDFTDQQWGILTKRFKILKPALIDLKPGDVIRIDEIEPGMVTGDYKGHRVCVPSESLELLPIVNESPLMLPEELKEDIAYPDIEQLPSKNDWATLLLHGKRLQFQKGEVIVPEGSKLQRLYQIESGFCSVVTTIPQEDYESLAKQSQRWKSSVGKRRKSVPFVELNIQTIGKGETFGELGLLTEEGSMASVIADGGPEDTTTIFMIEAANLSSLFKKSPKIGGRFANYIRNILKKRMEFESVNRTSSGVPPTQL